MGQGQQSAANDENVDIGQNIARMEGKVAQDSSAMMVCLTGLERYFRSYAKLEAQMARIYKKAAKTVTKVLFTLHEGAIPPEPSCEQVIDPYTAAKCAVPTWQTVRQIFLYASKLHDDFGNFVGQVHRLPLLAIGTPRNHQKLGCHHRSRHQDGVESGIAST